MASKRQRPNFGALMATGGFGVPDPLGESEISEDGRQPTETTPIEAAPKVATPPMPAQGERSVPAAASPPPEELAVSRAAPAHLTVVGRTSEPPVARRSVRVSEREAPTVARRNRTWRAGDDEYDLLIDIERKIYYSGALGKSRRFGPSTVIRAALRLAAKMPIESVVEEILSANDIEE